MRAPLVVVTGFGPFLDVASNPSGEVARALSRLPRARLGGARVVATVLPVTFAGAPDAVDRLLEGLDDEPVALLALGVQRGAFFRLELRARARLESLRPDTDGACSADLDELDGGERRTALDLERLAEDLRAAGGGDVRVSDDAGGYVCERVYHHVLGRAAELGVPGLFLHVPPVDVCPSASQVPIAAALVAALARDVARA